MKNVYRHFLALSMAAASLSSCSRATYSFDPHTPAYLGTTHAVSAPVAVAAPAAPAAEPLATAPMPQAQAVAPAPPAEAAPAPQARTAQPAAIATQPQVAKPTLVQRLVIKKVMKQLAKAESRQQNTAGTAHTAAKGASVTVAIIGLAGLVVGLIINSGLLITLGAIVLAVGIVLLILSAL